MSKDNKAAYTQHDKENFNFKRPGVNKTAVELQM